MNEPTAKRKASSGRTVYWSFINVYSFLEWYPKFTPNIITIHLFSLSKLALNTNQSIELWLPIQYSKEQWEDYIDIWHDN
jgi:hypothetical protein